MVNEVQNITKRIDATDYGADPTGQLDSTEAIRTLLEEIQNDDRLITIYFPKGEYHFYKSSATVKPLYTSNTSSLDYPTKWVSILIENQHNRVIDGEDSLFLFHGDVMGIAIIDSSNIQLKNLSIDYVDPDTVDITIIDKGEEEGQLYTDFYIPSSYKYIIDASQKEISWFGDCHPHNKQPYWQAKNTMDAYLVIFKGYDWSVRRHEEKDEEGRKISDPFVGVTKIVEQKPGYLRFYYKDKRPESQEIGNIFLLCNSRIRKTTGIFFWNTRQIQTESVNVHYLSGFGWLVQMCEDVRFSKVNFSPRLGTGKVTTSNADQIHVVGCKGQIEISESYFSLSHDDPINIHGAYLRVEEVIDERTLRLKYVHRQQGGYQQFFKGDEIEFFNRQDLKSFAPITTVEETYPPGSPFKGENLNRQTEIVILKDPLSSELQKMLTQKIKVIENNIETIESLYVVENISYAPSVIIRDSIFQSIPTRAILCTTRKPVIIENNIFKNISMATIYLSNDAYYWYESGPIRDMIIRNNVFYISSSGQDEWVDAPAIFVDPVLLPQFDEENPSNVTVHENICVENNEFILDDDSVMVVKNTKELTFKYNHIIERRKKSPTKEFFQYSQSEALNFEGNTFIGSVNHAVRDLDTHETLLLANTTESVKKISIQNELFGWKVIDAYREQLNVQEIAQQVVFIDTKGQEELKIKLNTDKSTIVQITGLIDMSKQKMTGQKLEEDVILKLYQGMNYFDFSLISDGYENSVLKLIVFK